MNKVWEWGNLVNYTTDKMFLWFMPVWNSQNIVAFIIGVLTSGIIAVLVIGIQYIVKLVKLKKKFGKAKGNYSCFSFEKINPNVDGSKPEHYKSTIEPNGSVAKIEYQGENVLSIKVTDKNGLIWEGNILMDLETLGTVAWRYINYPKENDKETHEFGLKRIIVKDSNCIYLVGEIEEGYGKEILIRS